jgi:hypothetical protein
MERRIVKLLWGGVRIGLAAILHCGVLAAAPPLDPVEHLQFWLDEVVVPATDPLIHALDLSLVQDDAVPIEGIGPIAAAAISGRLTLAASKGSVRITLVDTELREHLVGEFYLLLTGASEISLDGVCRETCLLDGVTPHRLKITIQDARLELERLELRRQPDTPVEDLAGRRERIRAAQHGAIVARINEQITTRDLGWQAGETTFSRMSFEDKKARCAGGRVPVLHGFEYYVGGVFSLPGSKEQNGGSGVFNAPGTEEENVGGGSGPISRFDWREKHRANEPGSPYYDGDPTGGGWMTPVTEQACSDCWAHAPVGLVEAMVNLSLNRHRDVDLSEQDLLSCSGGGDCDGGLIGAALDYMVASELVSELCFPYQGQPIPCVQRCPDPAVIVRIADAADVPLNLGEDAIKLALIQYGPLTFGIRDWWHYMVLVGFDRDPVDNATIWIVKNSYGEGWGESGFGRLKMPMDEIYSVHRVTGVRLIEQGQVVGSTCRDADGDGYAAWGLNAQLPAGCQTTNGQQDCNDADDSEGPADASGACLQLDPDPPAPPPIAPPPAPQPPAPAAGGGGGGGGSASLVLVAVLGWMALAEPRRNIPG